MSHTTPSSRPVVSNVIGTLVQAFGTAVFLVILTATALAIYTAARRFDVSGRHLTSCDGQIEPKQLVHS